MLTDLAAPLSYFSSTPFPHFLAHSLCCQTSSLTSLTLSAVRPPPLPRKLCGLPALSFRTLFPFLGSLISSLCSCPSCVPTYFAFFLLPLTPYLLSFILFPIIPPPPNPFSPASSFQLPSIMSPSIYYLFLPPFFLVPSFPLFSFIRFLLSYIASLLVRPLLIS